MNKPQLIRQVMALPPAERHELAEALWDSIERELPTDDEDTREAIALALRRDQELRDNPALGMSHEEVMAAARKALK